MNLRHPIIKALERAGALEKKWTYVYDVRRLHLRRASGISRHRSGMELLSALQITHARASGREYWIELAPNDKLTIGADSQRAHNLHEMCFLICLAFVKLGYLNVIDKPQLKTQRFRLTHMHRKDPQVIFARRLSFEIIDCLDLWNFHIDGGQ